MTREPDRRERPRKRTLLLPFLISLALALGVLTYMYAGLGPSEHPRRPARMLGWAPIWLPAVLIQLARFDSWVGRVLSFALVMVLSGVVTLATYVTAGCVVFDRCL